MHTCSFYFRERHNASRQFTFKSTLVIHLFLEIGQAEVCTVEYLEADAPAFRQTLACKLDAHFSKLIRTNFDGPSVGCKIVGHLQFLQLLHNALSFLRIQIGIQRLILNAIYEEHQYPQQNQNETCRACQCKLLLKGVTRKK